MKNSVVYLGKAEWDFLMLTATEALDAPLSAHSLPLLFITIRLLVDVNALMIKPVPVSAWF